MRLDPSRGPIRPLSRVPALFLTCTALGATAAAQAIPELSEVLFDEGAGGELWALGPRYKARFGVDGATFYPFLGSKAPRHFPLELRLESVRVGEVGLAFDAAVDPQRSGETVEYDRGALTELYAAGLEGLEHAFRFEELPVLEGDLVLRVAVESDLTATASPLGGLRFDGPSGGARYGAATAFDARGRSTEVAVAWNDDGIALTVPREFLARAELPLLVDPLVTPVSVDESPFDDRDPDAVYDASLDVHVVVWERYFTASDPDIVGAVVDGSGNLVARFLIDPSVYVSHRPRIAGIEALDRFLVAWAPQPNTYFKGRIVDLIGGPPAVGPLFDISGAHWYGLELGGHSGDTPPHRFLAAAWNTYSGLDEVNAQLLDENGQAVESFTWTDDTWEDCHYLPKVTKTTLGAPDGTHYWLLAHHVEEYCGTPTYVRTWMLTTHGTDSLFHGDISYGSQSIEIQALAPISHYRYLLVWRAQNELRARVVAGAPGPVRTLDIDPGNGYFDPAVGSDGSSVTVSFTEAVPPGPTQRVYVENYSFSPLTLELVLEERTLLSDEHGVAGRPGLSTSYGRGPTPDRSLVVWERAGASDSDVVGAIHTSEQWVRYCTAAPNSVGPGATIDATGSVSIGTNSFELYAAGCPLNRPGIFYLGVNQIEIPFGEGFRCIGGASRRITPVVVTDPFGEAWVPLDFDLPYGDLVQPGAPGINYQFWYRDPAGGPSNFNLTDALHVEHTP